MASNTGVCIHPVKLRMLRIVSVGLACSMLFGCFSIHETTSDDHLGRSPKTAELVSWGSAVLPSGAGLPKGRGTALEGQRIYSTKCSMCHGSNGEGRDPAGPQLVGGIGTLDTKNPVLTVGSYWPYSTSVWDFVHRAMPYTQPGTLSTNETYAVTAYLLYLNHIVSKDRIMDEKTLPTVRMPNRDGFVPDPRPDVGRRVAPTKRPSR